MSSLKLLNRLAYKSMVYSVLSWAVILMGPVRAESEDPDTKMSDLISRIADLESQMSEGGKTDDKNPGAHVSSEDLERLKEEVRALRDGRESSGDLRNLQDEMKLLREDMKQLQKENASLKGQKVAHKKPESEDETEEEKPAVKKGQNEPRLVHPSQVDSTEGSLKEVSHHNESTSQSEEDGEAVLNDLRGKATSFDKSEDEGEDDAEGSSKKKKGSKDLEKIREKATQKAQEVTPTLPAGDGEAAYNVAFALHDKGEYAKAEKAFSEFIKNNPKDNLVSQALYWKGDCCVQLRNFKDAKVIFVNAFKKNPKGPKAPHSLLKLGEVFAMEGKKENAGVIWDRLENTFPNMKSDMKADLASLRKQYGIGGKSGKVSKKTSES